MKQLKLLLTAALLGGTLEMQAFYYEGCSYNVLSQSERTCEITYCGQYYGSFTIPSSVTNTENGQDYTVTKIGDYVFSGSYLSEVNIPEGIVTIGKYAFSNFEFEVSLPSSLKTIEDYAFYKYHGQFCVLPTFVESIGDYAFSGSNIASVNIPTSLQSIGKGAFSYCSSLAYFHAEYTNEYFSSYSDGALYSKDGTELIAYPAYKSETSFEVPYDVKKIHDWAFSNCQNLQTISFNKNVESIGEKVFDGCNNLEAINVVSYNPYLSSEAGVLFNKDKSELIKYPANKSGESYTVPATVKKIGDLSFSPCNNLRKVGLQNGITTIGKAAFKNNYDFESISIPYTLETIDDEAFYSCESMKVTVKDLLKVAYIGDYAFAYCEALESSLSSEYLTNVGKMAFAYCNGLKMVWAVDAIENLGERAFYGCGWLTSVTLSWRLKTMGDCAFGDCPNLEWVELMHGAKVIGNSAFSNCGKLATVVIPATVESIGNYAFDYCTGLKNIVNYSTAPQIVDEYVFEGVPTTCALDVPNAYKDDYAEADVWNRFKNIGGTDRMANFSIGTPGMMTLWLDYPVRIPGYYTAYYASGTTTAGIETSVTLTPITTGVIPAKTGVILQGAKGNVNLYEADSKGEVLTSLLVGQSVKGVLGNNGYNYYKLTYSNNKDNFGFYLDKADGTVDAKPNKAYLKLPKTSGASMVRMRFIDDEASDIQTVVNEVEANNSDCYNLSGQKVGAGYKGIVVKNGKKIMVK